MLTGILRLAKDVSLSPLNNLAEFNMVRSEFAPYYGFTNQEVEQLFKLFEFNLNYLGKVKQMYNGYYFNSADSVYNPWSLVNCLNASLSNRAQKRRSFNSDENSTLRSYWTQSGTIEYISSLMLHPAVLDKFGQLLSSDELTFAFVDQLSKLDMDVVKDLLFQNKSKQLDDITEGQLSVIFTFLCYQGYFSISKVAGTAYTVKLPNLEVKMEINKLISSAMDRSEHSVNFSSVKSCLENFIIKHNEVESVKEFAQDLEKKIHDLISGLPRFDSFDQQNPVQQRQYIVGNENIIQCLLTACITTIKSVRLDSIGSEVCLNDLKRGDIFLTYQNLAIVIELKLEKTAAIALQQIHDKGYANYLKPNYDNICLIGINVNLDKSVSVALEFTVSIFNNLAF